MNNKCTTSAVTKLYLVKYISTKAHLDIYFLINCKHFDVFPKFVSIFLPKKDGRDTYRMKKTLLRNEIHKRNSRKK